MSNKHFLFILMTVLFFAVAIPILQPVPTVASKPSQPLNELPLDGATGVSLTPRLEASDFYDAEPSHTFAASQWLIRSTYGSVYDSGSVGPQAWHDVPAGTLDYSTTYYWRVLYQDSVGEWSSSSEETSFTTVPRAPTVSTVTPGSGKQGQTNLSVTITGNYLSGVTSVSFGSGITVNSFEVVLTWINANISIDASATPGDRDVSVTTPGGIGTKTAAFTVTQAEPTVTGVDPSSGSRGDTLTVTITGSNFTGVSDVNFGAGIDVNSYIEAGSTQVSAQIAIRNAAALGSRNVSVTTPGGTGTLTGAFTVTQAVPTVTGVNPSSGSQGDSLTVTITGNNLTGATSVSFGEKITATILTEVSDNEITVSIAIDASATLGLRDVSVTTPVGTGTGTGVFTVSQAAPIITTVSPAVGVQGDKPDVIITGTNLTGATSVSFGEGINITSFSVDSPTQITAKINITGSAASGPRDVSVTTPGGTVTKAGAFTVNPPAPTVTGLSVAAGTQGQTLDVSISGTNFLGTPSVSFGADITVNLPIVVVSPTEITATITISESAAIGARDVSVTTAGGTGTMTGGFTVSQAAPQVTGVNPASVTQGDTLGVTITGKFFAGVTDVSFGAGITVNSYTVDSSTQITANITIAGSAGTGARTVSVTTSAGAGTFGSFTVLMATLKADFIVDRTEVAVGMNVVFTDNTIGGVTPLHYNWSFGDSLGSTEQNPTHKYLIAGTFTVRLTVTDSASPANTAVAEKTRYITVVAGLLADFKADKTAVVVGQTVKFTDMSGGGTAPLKYQWDFNTDGTWDSTGQNPSYSYGTAGTYHVTLKVTDFVGRTDTERKDITVCALPQADYSVSAAVALPGQTITFTASCTGGVLPLTYEWDFNGDGVVDSTNQKPTFAYATSGVYTVSLKVTDAGGNSDTETKANWITVGTIAVAPHQIPPQGGTIQTADGRIAATFPAGAYNGDATVTILEVSASAAPKAPEGYKIGNSCFSVQAADSRGRPVTSLTRPVTITLMYSDQDLAAAGGDPSKLVLAYYNEATGKWTITDAAFNETNKTLSTTASHFSTWAILVKTESGGMPLWAKLLIALASTVAVGIVVWRAFSVKQTEQWSDEY